MATRHVITPPWVSRLWNLIPRLQLNDLKSLPLSPTAVVIPGITVRLPLPSDLGLGLGNNPFGIVFAVPKKKTSLSKRRQRRYAPTDKHVKPVRSLNECPSCGRVKRAHTVCTTCHEEIKQIWKAENGLLSREKLAVPESIDSGFLEILNEKKKISDIPNPGDFLKQLNKEDTSKRKPPMFEWEKLRDKSKFEN
ncbi:hypothetical protein V1520DRAFT_340380 [Lipomyces starkeyi]|uniref:Large ribosomal subunit protein bL32m n=1 Tax=Lipomyces starkeyi NRRL Y-11557 TaxID=675824 RepID=A0A1E3QBX8_LIPST|nr:hypothetical protein LIPSTDRAFT_62654 [Lipomyces starkeyi NRRL Y-11557]